MASSFRVSSLKKYLRWVILTITLGFIGQTLNNHWQEILDIYLSSKAWACLTMALGVTLLAHIWSAWVWAWIIQIFNQPIDKIWIVSVYLKTNIAKYLPGNVWHFVGRVRAIQSKGASTGIAVMSVILEPLLMAAAALILASFIGMENRIIQWSALFLVLVGIHPRILNPVLRVLSRSKLGKMDDSSVQIATATLNIYPFIPLLGEIVFVVMRGLGFILVLAALLPEASFSYLKIISYFSIAWLMGLVVPGAPGGLGVFEATALTLMTPTLPTAAILGSVAVYRLISTLAEILGAGMIWLDNLWSIKTENV